MNIVTTIMEELTALSTEEKRRVLPHFFKTGPGQYGEGDLFIGTTVPDTRRVAIAHKDASLEDVEQMLYSQWHEVRLAALLIMVAKAHKADDYTRSRLFNFYLRHTARINNWDLVDLSAPTLVGDYLSDKTRDTLYSLAQSQLLWEARIAIVATLAFIRRGDLDDTYKICNILMNHSHELIHKACGWMLREAGKRNPKRLYTYVMDNRCHMPRTMLRYAIERFAPSERKELMEKPKYQRNGLRRTTGKVDITNV